MIKKIPGEVWKQMQFTGYKQLRKKYAVSNTGRAASYTSNVAADGKLLNGSLTSGYRTLNLHVEDGNGTIYIHSEVPIHHIRLINLLGVPYSSYKVSDQHTLTISDLPTGLYFIEALTNGKKFASKKVIVLND